jgi:hypothetical protein
MSGALSTLEIIAPELAQSRGEIREPLHRGGIGTQRWCCISCCWHAGEAVVTLTQQNELT